ncbi:hypothetical protein [Klebsiella quasipneumoniae]|uniref:hypothetical protein n=1 Tax=Klebsiella quasipneumoniae TaxID=1463165 RepID=UPI0023B19964|nr:hypothetical protein [Klebsiella quasipneumoniae]
MFDTSTTSTTSSTSVAATGPQLPNSNDLLTPLDISNLYDPDTVADSDASKYIVGREGQTVIDGLNQRAYVITHVGTEDAKYKSTLKRIGFVTDSDDNSSDIIGLPGRFAGNGVLGIDYSVRPPRAVIDGRVWAPDAAYGLLYKGVVIGDTGQVISVQYATNGDLISNQVPTKLAAVNNMTNHSIFTTTAFSVTQTADELPDGSLCTLVFFDAAGNMIPEPYELGVMHTALLRDHQIGIKYVSAIELISPWFTDTTDPTTLNIPINVAMSSVQFSARIHYNDGSTKEQLIDGTKCAIIGLNEYKPTTVGQRASITLRYSFDEDEQALIAEPNYPNMKSETYQIVCTQVNGAYSPKLYTYPVWNGTGYSLKHYLYDLTRGYATDVTQHVTLNDTSPAFQPANYGVQQDMVFNLTLSDVSSTFKAWTLVQHTSITLYKANTGTGRRWAIQYSSANNPYVAYNVGYTEANGVQSINLAGSILTISDWLNRLYYPVEPLIDATKESAALAPNYIRLVDTNGVTHDLEINDWNKPQALTSPVASGQTLFLQWIQKSENGAELQLATTGVVVDVAPSN